MVNSDDREPGIERAVGRVIDGLDDHRLYTVAEKRRYLEERDQKRRDAKKRWNFAPYPISGSFAEDRALAARLAAGPGTAFGGAL